MADGNGASFDPILVNRIQEIAANLETSRSMLIKQLIDPRRDINDECGYPDTNSLTADQYRELYDRFGIATRVVEVFPQESWLTSPSVYEDENAGVSTAFEEAWDDLCNSLRGTSWYRGETGNPVWEHLRRLDELSGVGAYGVMLIGLDDGLDLSAPVEGIDDRGTAKGGTAAKRKVTFLRSFDESMAAIGVYENDITNPRYGMPKEYSLTFTDPNSSTAKTGIGLTIATRTVHWTRVLHVADNLGTSEVIGVPRMQAVFNHLVDLRKVYGGSAEMYWRGAFPGLSLETHPQLGGDVNVSRSSVREAMEQYMNGLQRYLLLMGMSAKTLSPQVVDPSSQLNVQIEAICMKLGIPVRIFKGSERGQLASSQDERAWRDRMRRRQDQFITPRIIAPFVDRLIAMGVLPVPKESYTVWWPDIAALSEQEKAQVALTKTQALGQYVQGGIEAVVTPLDYLTKFLGTDDEEAQSILEETMGRIEEEDTGASPLLSLVGGLTGIAELFKAAQAGALSEEQLKQILMLFFKLTPARADALIADGIPEPLAAAMVPPGGAVPPVEGEEAAEEEEEEEEEEFIEEE